MKARKRGKHSFSFAVLVILALAAATSPSSAGTEAPKPIRIGVIASATGPAGFIGAPEIAAVNAAAKKFNAGGGILGRKVEVVARDTQGDPSKALAAARAFAADDSILAVIGPDLSSNVRAAQNVLQGARIPHYVLTSSISPPANSYQFAAYNSAPQTWEIMLKWFADRGHATRLGVLASTDTTGEVSLKTIQELAPKYGIRIYAERFDVTAPDLTPQIRRLASQNVQGYTIAVSGAAFGVAMRGLAQLDLLDQPIIGFGSNLGPQLKDLLAGITPRLLVFQAWAPQIGWQQLPAKSPQRPKLQEFDRYVGDVTVYGAAAWDGTHIFLTAAKQILSKKQKLTRTAVRNVVRTMTYVGAVATIRFTKQDHRGTSLDAMRVVRWVDGKILLQP